MGKMNCCCENPNNNNNDKEFSNVSNYFFHLYFQFVHCNQLSTYNKTTNKFNDYFFIQKQKMFLSSGLTTESNDEKIKKIEIKNKVDKIINAYKKYISTKNVKQK